MSHTLSKHHVVQVEDVTVAYDAKPVLWDVDLDIPRGVLMAIVGPNGAGKTTLIKAILNLVKPLTGKVRFAPGLLDGRGPKGRRVGYVPQSGSVDWDFPATAIDVVLMGCYGKLGWFSRPGKKERAFAQKMLEKVGMGAFASRQISQLSGGQQQRVFLARALAQEAELYFMDEPFRGVDVQTERTIIELLKELQQQGKTVVVVHHDLQTVTDYFDYVTIINLQVVASGPVEEAFTDENLRKAYRSTTSLLRARGGDCPC